MFRVLAYPADRAPEEYAEQARVVRAVVPATAGTSTIKVIKLE